MASRKNTKNARNRSKKTKVQTSNQRKHTEQMEANTEYVENSVAGRIRDATFIAHEEPVAPTTPLYGVSKYSGLDEYIPSEGEYEMLRAEILQYMEEYQNLRNMMYVGTATLLGINSAVWVNLYLFLLPLIIILPSYIIYIDYWKSVTVASVYIQLFLEQDKDGRLTGKRRWETMHQEFSLELKRKKDGSFCWKRRLNPLWSGMQCHKIPYVVCTALCLAIYGYFVRNGQFNGQPIDTNFASTIGLIVAAASLLVFLVFRSPDTETIFAVWKQTKNRMDGKIAPRK